MSAHAHGACFRPGFESRMAQHKWDAAERIFFFDTHGVAVPNRFQREFLVRTRTGRSGFGVPGVPKSCVSSWETEFRIKAPSGKFRCPYRVYCLFFPKNVPNAFPSATDKGILTYFGVRFIPSMLNVSQKHIRTGAH